MPLKYEPPQDPEKLSEGARDKLAREIASVEADIAKLDTQRDEQLEKLMALRAKLNARREQQD